jgi:hypothetical protein
MEPVASGDMTKREPIRIALRLYDQDAARFTAIKRALSTPHLDATDADAARFIFERGYGPAEAELGIAKPPTASAAKGAKK